MQRSEKKQEFLSVWLLLAGFCALALGVLLLCLTSIAELPDNVGRELTAEEMAAVIARNSPLTEYAYLSPNANFPREAPIRKITIHHMAEDLDPVRLAHAFGNVDRKASANYGIGTDGTVVLYVEECNRAWTSSSPENDHQAVTIEVANDEVGGDWHVSDTAYDKLLELCTDICRRNGIERLSYTGDAVGNLTIHKMFNENTQCPGPYLESRMEDIAAAVNERLAEYEQIG